MPKKSKTPTATEEIAIATDVLPPLTTEPLPPVKKSKKSSDKKSSKKSLQEEPVTAPVEPEPVAEPEPEPVIDVVTECAENGVCPIASKKTKRVITKQDIITDLDVVFTEVLTQLKDKALAKKVKQLKSDLVKLFKLRNIVKKENDNPNSGFRKPVDVSQEMRKFLNLPPSELTRRLDITKKLCDYIKENNLQDARDRRNILPDATLKQLLSVNEADPPLTYYSIQQKLKPHIIKI